MDQKSTDRRSAEVRSAGERFGKLSFYLLGLAIVTAASMVARRSASMAESGDSVFGLAYGFGPAAYNLVKLHRFGLLDPDHQWWAVALRMPFIPWFLAALSVVSTNLTFQFLTKNIVFYSIFLRLLDRLATEYRITYRQRVIMVLVLFLVPFNILTGCRLEVEEGYLFPMMMILYVLLLLRKTRTDFILCALVIAAIYLTKSSAGLLCIAASLWAVLSDLRRNRSVAFHSFLPVMALLIAVVAWGGYVKQRTGRFAVGVDESSWNGENFYKANNANALALYPYKTLDTLEHTGRLPVPVVTHNEWELNDAQRELGLQFVRQHRADVLRMDLLKARVLFFEVRESPGPVHGKDRITVMLSNAIDHLLFAVFLAFAGFDLWRRKVAEYTLLALVIVAAYLTPYFAGFLYQRHLVPLFGVVGIALCLRLMRISGVGELRVT